MANCKNCIHWNECSKQNGITRYYGKEIASNNVEELCKWFISTEDVVPRSEVEQLQRNLEQCENGYRQQIHIMECKHKDEVEKLTINMNAYGLTAKRLAEENEELKQEKIYHRETEKLCDRYLVKLEQAKQEVAEQIFEEIDKILKPQEKYLYCNPSLTYVYELITELRKKCIGE